MGAMKENPRYHVICFRVSDEEFEEIEEKKPARIHNSEFIRQALFEHLRRNKPLTREKLPDTSR